MFRADPGARQHDAERRSCARCARAHDHLSETVEKLLADYVDAERRKREEREDLIDATSEMAKAHDAEHVLWGQAFSTL